jgi:endoglucanase
MRPTLVIACLLAAFTCLAQPEKPVVFLSQTEMTPNGGQPYDDFYWLNSNLASLSKANISFPVTGSYRFDISAYAKAGTSEVSVLIDGTSKGSVDISSTSTAIYSLLINQITAGTHTITIQLSNFSAGSNHCRVGLIYFTNTSSATPYIFPDVKLTSLPPSSQYLTANHFRSKLIRGFNLSTVYTLNELKAKNIPAARETGANIGRYWISASHAAGSSDYFFSSGPTTNIGSSALETLDSAVRIAEEAGIYLMITLEVFPDQANCDLWGDNADAIARRNGVKAIWQQIAARYKDKTIVAGYDLINEPRLNFNVAEYLRWQGELVEAIRTIDPDHVIAIECLKNSMYGMMLPLPYDNLIYSPHSYSPLTITHQGVNAYTGITDVQERRKYPDANTTKSDLSDALSNVRTFSQRFRAPVWVGELSCINWAPLNDQGEWSSTRWIDDDISILETEGWSWCYHAWREFQAWDAEIPSSYYTSFTYTNAAPFTRSNRPSGWTAARTSNAPTILMLRKWFGLNASIPTGNIPPTVNIISPEVNSSYDTTQFIVVDVEVSDSDGSIDKVEVYNNDTLLLSKSAAPYSFVIDSLQAGTYSLTVKAYDNSGDVTTSQEVPVEVSNVAFTVLPLQLGFFNAAMLEKGQAEFKWQTITELNMSHYELEVNDQQTRMWSKIGEVIAVGNSAVTREYSFVGHLNAGSYQVRLKEVFKDGSFFYSAIRYVDMTEPVSAKVNFIAHSRKIILLSGTSSTLYHVKIFDLSGKAIVATTLNSGNAELKVPSVVPGIYVLSVQNETGKKEAKKILIN